MFIECELTNLSALSSWNTENVTDMSNMFSNCTTLTDASAINDWDIRNVAADFFLGFRYMFINCPSHPELAKRAGVQDTHYTFTPS